MKKFKKFGMTTMFYTDNHNKIPGKITSKVKKMSVDFTNEKFECLVFVPIKMGIVRNFILVTDLRVITYKISHTGQNYFSDITGIELNIGDNIVLRSAGNRTSLFEQTGLTMVLPTKDLIELLKSKINNLWLEAKKNKTVKSDDDAFVTLEKLKKLLDAGVITVEEFNNKKTELLNKI